MVRSTSTYPISPNEKCQRVNLEVFNINEEQYCPSCGERIFAIDTLRLHEEIDEFAPTNVGVLRRFEKLIRHIYLAHLLRILELKNKSTLLSVLNDLAIVVKGPLAIAGTAAWVHGSLMKVLNRFNMQLRAKGLNDLLVIGMKIHRHHGDLFSFSSLYINKAYHG